MLNNSILEKYLNDYDLMSSILTNALRGKGCLSDRDYVTGWRQEKLGGFGLIGMATRIRLEYSNSNDLSPASVIIKCPNPAFPDSFPLALVESQFYSSNFHLLANLKVPTLYFAEVDTSNETCLIILEDLNDDGFITQLNGCSLEQATLALEEISKFHAFWWNYEPSSTQFWIQKPKSTSIFKFCRHWLLSYTGDWPDMLGETPSLLVKNIDKIAHKLEGDSHTLVHGDFHCQNMAFGMNKSSEDVTFIDFQCMQLATPMLDVARFIATSLTIDTRKTIEAELLSSYHGELKKYKITDYSSSEWTDDYRRALLWNLVTPLALHVRNIITTKSEWGKDLPILKRCIAVIEDWDAVSML